MSVIRISEMVFRPRSQKPWHLAFPLLPVGRTVVLTAAAVVFVVAVVGEVVE